MKKYDEPLRQTFTERFGSAPETIGYVVDSAPLWLTILLAGGLLGAMLQKPYIVGFYGNEARFIKTSMWKTTTLKEESMTLRTSDIAEAKLKKFGFLHTFLVKTNDGKKHRLVMNTLYKALDSQPAAIESMKRFCGVS